MYSSLSRGVRFIVESPLVFGVVLCAFSAQVWCLHYYVLQWAPSPKFQFGYNGFCRVQPIVCYYDTFTIPQNTAVVEWRLLWVLLIFPRHWSRTVFYKPPRSWLYNRRPAVGCDNCTKNAIRPHCHVTLVAFNCDCVLFQFSSSPIFLYRAPNN